MKRVITIVALMCAVALQANAQTSNIKKLSKEVEKKVKLADKHPKDGKMQLRAASAILNDSLRDEFDFDRALTYANRALKIAQERPAPQDTLLGLTCQTLGMIYMGKKDIEKSLDFYEKALDGFEVELGRLDPVTNGFKLASGFMIASTQPSRGFTKILEAISDNNRAPQDQRIQNMDEANIVLEMILEMLLAEQTEHFQYALPYTYIDGKRYFFLQTESWNMEHPLVGWLAQGMLSSDEKDNESEDDDIILFSDDGTFMVLPKEDKDKWELTFNFHYYTYNRNLLEVNENDARIKFFNEDEYNQILSKFREYKVAKK